MRYPYGRVARTQWIYSARSRRRVVIHILRALDVSIACTLQYYNTRSEQKKKTRQKKDFRQIPITC